MFKRGTYFNYAMANGMFYFSWGMFACIISVALAGKNMSATEISLISSAASLFAILFQPVTGYLADKFQSPKKVGVVCLFLAIITGIAFGYSKSFILLFLMNGLTQGFLNGTMGLSDSLAARSTYSFGSIRVWGSVLYAIAAQLAGIVYDNISPLFNYYIFAIGVAITIVGFSGMKDIAPEETGNNDKVTIKEVIRNLIKNKKYLLFLAILCVSRGVEYAQFTYLPLFIKELGGSTTLVGTTLLLSTLSEIPMVFFSDRVIRKFGYRSLMIFSCIMTIIRFVWYSTLPTPQMIMVVFFWQGLTSIIMILVAVKIIPDIVDKRYVNTAYGISLMLSKGLFSLIYVIVIGAILDGLPGNEGYRFMYWIFVGSTVLALALVFKFKEK